MTRINLSVIIPAFNEEAIIENTLKALTRYLKANPQLGRTEIIVVAAGTDRTAEIARRYAVQFNDLKIITPPNAAGKGRDVSLGFQAARGKYQLFTDADLSTPLNYILPAVRELESGAEVVIGKRNLRIIHHQSLRTIVSVASNYLIRFLLLPGIGDSQCGFKAFRASVAKRLFASHLRIHGWAFDVEILYHARHSNALITQLPISDWHETRTDGLRNDRLMHAVARTLGDILLLRCELWMRYLESKTNLLISLTALASGSLSLWIGMRQSVWFDEAYSISLAQHSFAQIIHFTSLDVHPPLFYILLKVWMMIFGTHDLALRSFSAICSASSIGLGLLLVKRLWKARITLYTIPFLLAAPFLLRYGFEIRMYVLASLIGIGATYVLVKATESSSSREQVLLWGLYAVLVAAGMYTLYYMVLLWIAHILWCLYFHRLNSLPEVNFKYSWLVAYIVAGVLFLPWLPTFIHQLNFVQTTFWIPAVGYRQIVNIGSLFFNYLAEWQLGPLSSLIFLSVTATALYFVITAFQISDIHHRRSLTLLLFYAIVPVLVMYFVSLPPFRPLFLERYISQTIIGAYLLVGVAIALVLHHKFTIWHTIAAMYVLTVFIAGVTILYQVGNYNFDELYKPTAYDITTYINHNSSQNIVVITDGPEAYLPLLHYLTNRDVKFYSTQPTLPYGGYALLHSSPERISNASKFSQPFWLVYRGSPPSYVNTRIPIIYTHLGRYQVALYK